MSRSVTANFRSGMNAPETDNVPIILLTIEAPDDYDPPAGAVYTGATVRFSNHNTTRFDDDPLRYGTDSRGHEYNFLPFDITLPEEGEDAEFAAQIVVEGVSRELTPALASVTTPPIVTVEIVSSGDPDTVEVEFPEFDLIGSTIDAGRVVVSLAVDTMTSEPYPADDFTPGKFGGLWTTT